MFGGNTARNNKFHLIIALCSAVPLSIQSSYHDKNWLQIGGVLGHCIDAKISPKADSEKAQTMVSENEYTYPRIDVVFFRTFILSLLPSTGNNVQVSFLIHRVPHTSASLRVLWYRQVFTQLSLHIGASDFTCRLMIANLLYMVVYSKTECIAYQEM